MSRSTPSLPAAMTRGQVATAGTVAAALTVAWLLVVPHVSSAGGDAAYYVQMAADPKAVAHTPYAYRVLTPWLAHALGGPRYPGYTIAFRALTAGFLAAAGPAVYLICRRLGGAHLPALVGMAALLSLPGWLFNLGQPYMSDPAAMSLTAWSLTAVVYGWNLALPLLLTALGLARETVAAMALPIYMWMRARWIDLGAAWRVVLVMGPALLATWAIRQPMIITGWGSVVVLLRTGWEIVLHQRLQSRPEWWSLYAFTGSLGVWWIFGAYGRRYGGRLWWLLVPVFAQFIVGGDWSRFALYAFPVVIPAGAIAVWRHPRRALLLVLAAAQAAAVLVDLAVDGVLKVDATQPSMYLTAVLMLVAVPLVWWPYRREPAEQVEQPASPAPDVVPASTRT
jgi:hypothetical protein